MLFNVVALLLTFVLALASVASSAPPPSNNKVTIRSNGRFCLLMPPRLGGGISENENRAISWCTNSIGTVPNARILPSGFIVSKHFYTNPSGRYTQVTGRFNRDKFDLSRHDHGGQNDPNHPSGAKCVGYEFFVELVEPDVQHYCLRCCHHRVDCPTDKSTKGCKVVIPGNYS
ncbi:hypothetical protein B0O80DRAFT_426470 [Mortierella sp. GBAus27b]|nr:hypothetical protein B0O80DRAFT_426470 [Mortierella sp. GBAus27b]